MAKHPILDNFFWAVLEIPWTAIAQASGDSTITHWTHDYSHLACSNTSTHREPLGYSPVWWPSPQIAPQQLQEYAPVKLATTTRSQLQVANIAGTLRQNCFGIVSPRTAVTSPRPRIKSTPWASVAPNLQENVIWKRRFLDMPHTIGFRAPLHTAVKLLLDYKEVLHLAWTSKMALCWYWFGRRGL